MFSTLRVRITLLVVAFCVLMGATFLIALNMAYASYFEELRQRQGQLFTARVVAMYPQLAQPELLNRADIEESFERLLLLEPSSALYLLDATGRVRAGYTKQRSIGSKATVSLEPIAQLLGAKASRVVLGNDPDFPEYQCLFAVAPLLHNGAPAGYLYMLMRPADVAEDAKAGLLFRSTTNRTAMLLMLGVITLSGLLVLGVMALLTRPLRRLAAAADAVRGSADEGTFEPTALPHLQRNDEIGRLSRALRDMVERLHEQVQRVRRMDATRRDWVASISHDLRTPLTSLMGHLETIALRDTAAGNSMPEAERRQFVEVALRNARHMDRLSASLFDFARLDSDEVKPDCAPAHVGELLDDLAARFATAASQRGISIEVQYADGLPLATVDLALLERAIANLIDNGLRYTPNSGKIILNAHNALNNLHIIVQDSGAGVPPADLPKVFERFFQGSEQREGRGHAGLGLAIVKRVAELHGGSVKVTNAMAGGVVTGACFELSLPLQH